MLMLLLFKSNHGLKEIRILTDIEEKKSTESFENLAEKIAGMILSSTPQYTIGIYGKWGTGKTTLMRAIQRKFSEQIDGDTKEWISSA